MTSELSNKVIHGLWVGQYLSNLEVLTLKSFKKHGHEFHLWLYQPLETPLPDGIIIRDANQIIAEEQIFQYKSATSNGIGKGSYAGFSDIFRYKLLYELGGWWSDMDVTCLRYLDVSEAYFFPNDVTLKLTGKLMKAPAKSELMKSCYQEALATIDQNNDNWYKPINILIDNVKSLDLDKFIVPNIINWDSYVFLDVLRNSDHKIPSFLHAFHWSNEQWRNRGLDKNEYIEQSTYKALLLEYQVISNSNGKVHGSNFSFGRRIQLTLFKFLFDRPNILMLLKKIKDRFSNRHDLWS